MKHHYVPQFLLRRWCDEAGKLRSFKVLADRVLCTAQAPKHTGYENALYAVVANALGINEDHLERKFFSPLDSNAAVVLGKIERHESISPNERIAWAFFLNSLRMRQPDVLAHLRTDGMKMLRQFLAMGDDALPLGWPSTERWLEAHHPGMMEARGLIAWLTQMVLHDEMTKRFESLDWWGIEFEPGMPKLLLSDLPIHWEGGVATDKFFVQMPIAPNRVFFGTASEQTEAHLLGLPRDELVRRINRSSLASSTSRIWGADEQEGRAIIEANRDALGANVETFDLIAAKFRARRANA